MQKWRQWQAAPQSEWSLALEREAVIRRLAELNRLTRTAVEQAVERLGLGLYLESLRNPNCSARPPIGRFRDSSRMCSRYSWSFSPRTGITLSDPCWYHGAVFSRSSPTWCGGCVANSLGQTGRAFIVLFNAPVHAGASDVTPRRTCWGISICNRSFNLSLILRHRLGVGTARQAADLVVALCFAILKLTPAENTTLPAD